MYSFGANLPGRGASQAVAGADIWPGTYPGAGFHGCGAFVATAILQLARVSVSKPIPGTCALAGGDRQFGRFLYAVTWLYVGLHALIISALSGLGPISLHEWGQRYLLPAYPLLVVLSLLALADLSRTVRAKERAPQVGRARPVCSPCARGRWFRGQGLCYVTRGTPSGSDVAGPCANAAAHRAGSDRCVVAAFEPCRRFLPEAVHARGRRCPPHEMGRGDAYKRGHKVRVRHHQPDCVR